MCMGNTLIAQEDTLSTLIDEVEIRATRISTSPLQQPYSLATYNASPLQETRQQLSLQEYLYQIPGLFSLNANNYAQDLRISIRGFGARAAFGIRGVKIVVDGIPETTPDGQGQIDNLNVGIVERLEVLKGPSAALYGNASGGVIQVYSKADFKENFQSAALTLGSFGMQQYQIGRGVVYDKTRAIFQGTHTLTSGYRDQSRLVNTNFNVRAFHDFSEKSKLNFQVNYTISPVGDDPGGINAESVMENRRQARDRNLLFRTGEAINQLKIGSRYRLTLDEGRSVQLYGFYSNRGFEGRIPIPSNGWIDLQRNYMGQGGHYKLEKDAFEGKSTLQVGYELALQRDVRQRFMNNEGVKGDLVLDQVERFSSAGIYALNHFKRGPFLVALGLRYDLNNLGVNDKKTDDGDQSGKQNLAAFNPSIGLNYEFSKNLHAYANFRSGFETPALSELSANPTGDAGFNENLKSQRANNYEIGAKGVVGDYFDFDATFFYINTANDLVPFELEDFPDRTFYRNAGNTTRSGLELWGRYRITSALQARASYAYSNFKYKNYAIDNEDFGGNVLPAIPPHFLTLQLAYQDSKGWNARLQHRYTAEFYANDANDATEPTYQVTDLSAGYRLAVKDMIFTPFVGINNIFNTKYSDNVRINAFGGRYYEPAAGINFYGGVRWKM